MWSPETEPDWQRLSAQALAELKAWRAAHPRATLAEIEQEVDRRLAAARAQVLAATAQAGPEGAAGAAPPPPCPACGAPTVWDGTRRRRLTTTHQQELVLDRRHARCPRCGAGVSPPG